MKTSGLIYIGMVRSFLYVIPSLQPNVVTLVKLADNQAGCLKVLVLMPFTSFIDPIQLILLFERKTLSIKQSER